MDHHRIQHANPRDVDGDENIGPELARRIGPNFWLSRRMPKTIAQVTKEHSIARFQLDEQLWRGRNGRIEKRIWDPDTGTHGQQASRRALNYSPVTGADAVILTGKGG